MAIKIANVAADVTIIIPTVELAEIVDFLERTAASGSSIRSFYFCNYSFSSKAFVFYIFASALILMFSNSSCNFLASGTKGS